MFTTNAGGLDEYFQQISPLTLPNDMDHLAEISRHYGYVFLSPEQSLPQPEPHEAWHVSQQEQGRVRPISAVAGASVNDRGLEREAERMGSNAAKQPKQN